MRSWLLASVAACAVVAPFTMAHAQEAGGPAAAAAQVETVVVTARKREESIQNAPLAVTAVSDETIKKLFVYDLTDLNHQAPNLQIEGVGAIHRNAAVIFSRGIGYANVDQGQDPAVGVSVDGVFYGRNIGALQDFLDVDHVEILRGPQGTLYGRNTVGGVVNITTKKADPSQYEVEANVRVGNLERLDYGVIANLPVSDTFALRLAARSQYEEGPFKNAYKPQLTIIPGPSPQDNSRLGGFDVKTIRLSAHWTPTQDLTFDLSETHVRDRSPSVGTQNGSVPTDLMYFAFKQPGFGYPGGPTDPYTVQRDFPSGDYQDTDVVILNGRYVAPWFEVVSVTGYMKAKNWSYNDYDGTALPLLETAFGLHQRQFSQELRLQSVGSSRLQWVLGGYYFRQRWDAAQHFFLPIFAPTAPFQDDLAIGHGTMKAVFAQVDYHVTDALEVSVGARYTKDTKDLYRILQHPTGTDVPPILNPDGSVPKETSSDVTYHAGADYRFNPDVMVYAKYDTGFVGGGWNTRSNLASTIGPFKPEKAKAWEVGLKSDWFEHRLRANVAAFWNKYDDLQVGTFKVVNSVDGEQQVVANDAFERARGVEVELNAVPIPDLRINAAVGYLDAKYTSFIADLTGTPFHLNGQPDPCGGLSNHADKNGPCYIVPAYSPEWTAHLDVSYDFQLEGRGTLTPNVQVNYESKHYTDIFNTPGGTQPAFTLVNASLNYQDPTGHWRVSLWAKNLFDKRYIISEVPTAGLFTQLFFADPRTFGIDVTYHWGRPR